MSGSTVRLRGREEVAEGTTAFHFDRPREFQFKGGQSVDVTLIDPPESDSEGNTRTFSIASAPRDQQLMIATRMRDTAFKRVLATLPIGAPVQIDGPAGSFALHHNAAKPGVLLAGGIGITPFRSMIHEATAEEHPRTLYLFYSNSRPENAPFLDELEKLAATNSTFHFIPTMTEMAKSGRPWHGATGVIDGKMLHGGLSNLHGPIYYIAGPPAMVGAMREMLSGSGVDEDDIRTEEFSGY